MNKILLIGGVYDDTSGRPSSVIKKLADSLTGALKDLQQDSSWTLECLNGGSYETLVNFVDNQYLDLHDVIIWFADIPNDKPKLIERLSRIQSTLIISKNNSTNKYTRYDLLERMRIANAVALVEFRQAPDGLYEHVLHTTDGASNFQIGTSIERLAFCIGSEIVALYNCFVTPIRESFSIPTPNMPGGFGFERKHHVHEGVDLYVPEGTSIYNMCTGTVAYIGRFTGPAVGSPWWNDTWCVMIETPFGTFNYGEIQPNKNLAIGEHVPAGSRIGNVISVLKKDKGRPMSMLHLEMYNRWCKQAVPITEWPLNAPRPKGLGNVTPMLKQFARTENL